MAKFAAVITFVRFLWSQAADVLLVDASLFYNETVSFVEVAVHLLHCLISNLRLLKGLRKYYIDSNRKEIITMKAQRAFTLISKIVPKSLKSLSISRSWQSRGILVMYSMVCGSSNCSILNKNYYILNILKNLNKYYYVNQKKFT